MFIDASAIIAMLADEAQGDAFADALAGADRRLTSAIAIWEAVAGLAS
jgi:ribonuclease VapC